MIIYKIVQGKTISFTGTCRWNEYYPGPKLGFMWNKMPETMLAKCTEAKVLRMGFPGELSGLYIPEEMEQSSTPAAQSEKTEILNEKLLNQEMPETPVYAPSTIDVEPEEESAKGDADG